MPVKGLGRFGATFMSEVTSSTLQKSLLLLVPVPFQHTIAHCLTRDELLRSVSTSCTFGFLKTLNMILSWQTPTHSTGYEFLDRFSHAKRDILNWDAA
jgi:hypothetical protein